ncbi:YybH family protein [Kitasatospora sp. NPDC058162]|uniref:YybH family protein n=1 Tax=Kitasatospora sp. NPDC058162 TaxID=3346362 RepID=UPI0036DAE24D
MRHPVITDPAQLPKAFEEALNAGDVDAVLALFAPGAAMRTVTGERVTGAEALRAEIGGTVAARGRLTNVQRHTLVGAGTALLVTDWTLEVDTPDGERITPTGTTANIARQDADGHWRFTVLNPLGTA